MDFDGDSYLDVALTGFDGVYRLTIMFGRGNGTFPASVVLPAGDGATSISVGDFAEDGISDLIVTNEASNTFSLFRGSASGPYPPSQNFVVIDQPGSSSVADFNADGNLDLAIGSGSILSEPAAAVALGDGAGSFTVATFPGLSWGKIFTGDFDGDGVPDIALSYTWLFLLSGNGDGTFSPPRRLEPITLFSGAADFNGDGVTDLAGTSTASLAILLSSRGRLDVPLLQGSGIGGSTLASADFNADSNLDIAMGQGPFGPIEILTGDGAGNYSSVSFLFTPGDALFAGSIDSDPHPDIVAVSRERDSVFVLLGTGGATFAPATELSVGNEPRDVAVGDLDFDGRLDLVAVNFLDNTVSVLRASPGGGFLPASHYAVGNSPEDVVIADFNGDLNLDVATADFASNAVSLLLGTGNGQFGARLSYDAGLHPIRLLGEDIDRDGRVDLLVLNDIVTNDEVANVAFLRGNGSGGFATPVFSAVFDRARDWTLVDLNQDEVLDLALTSFIGVEVLVGNGIGGFASSGFFRAGWGGTPILKIDNDSDGRDDLVVAGLGYLTTLRNTNCLTRNLLISTEPPACATAGEVFQPQPTVRLSDDGGNTVCEAGRVTASIAPGTGATGALLRGSADRPLQQGVAQFSNLRVDRPGAGYKVRFSGLGFAAVSRTFSAGPLAITSVPVVCPYAAEVSASIPDMGPRAQYIWRLDNGSVQSGNYSPLIKFRAGPSGTVELRAIVRAPGACDLIATSTVAIVAGSACPAPVGFFTVPPCRVADTREPAGASGGPALSRGAMRVFPVSGRCGIPASARSVAVNVTVVEPTEAGHLTVFPGGMPIPIASTVNFRVGIARNNNAILALGAAGDLAVQCTLAAEGSAHFVLDVTGYFE